MNSFLFCVTQSLQNDDPEEQGELCMLGVAILQKYGGRTRRYNTMRIKGGELQKACMLVFFSVSLHDIHLFWVWEGPLRNDVVMV